MSESKFEPVEQTGTHEATGVLASDMMGVSTLQYHHVDHDDTNSIASRQRKNKPRISSGTNPLQRRSSGSGATTNSIFGDADIATAATESEFDVYAANQINAFHKSIGVIDYRVTQLEATVSGFANIGAELDVTNETLQDVARSADRRFEEMDNVLGNTNESIQRLAQEVGLANFDITRRITELEQDLVRAYYLHLDATAVFASANGERATADAQAEIETHQETMDEAAKEILVLRAQENLGQSTFPLVEDTIDNLQKQLRQVIRKKQTDMSATATNSWSLRNLWATDKDAQALRSVQKLAKNSAFSGLEKRNDVELAMNQRLLELMTHATFALSHFSKIHTPAQSAGASAAHRLPAEVVINTPTRTLSSSAMKSPAAQQQQPPQQQQLDADIVNHVVMEVMRAELAEIQTEAGGLIGSPNKNLQYWGKVLMIIALSILATVSAVALMSMLGFATPAFLVPYLAAVQSMSMITTVLNFVAAKLTIDLNTAAAVTAVAVAGTFGMFGKVTHYAGAPTSLKSDLDRAAQDLEAALADTPAANYVSLSN